MKAADLHPAHAGHLLHFYRDDAELASVVGNYLVEGLRGGEAVVILATAPHVRQFSSQIEAAGFSPLALMQSGMLTILDAHELLPNLVVDGLPDPDLFDAVIGGLLRETKYRSSRIRVFGELVAILWERGEVEAVIELESLWNGLLAALDVGLFCAYPSEVADSERDQEVTKICQHHDAVSGFTLSANGFHLTAQAAFPMSRTSPGAARRFLAKTLGTWESGHLISDAASVLTELVTNAMVHARSHFSVTMVRQDAAIRLSVHDASTEVPRISPPGGLEEGGRGLVLVESLADRWGVEPDSSGKSVWVEFELGASKDGSAT